MAMDEQKQLLKDWAESVKKSWDKAEALFTIKEI